MGMGLRLAAFGHQSSAMKMIWDKLDEEAILCVSSQWLLNSLTSK